MKTNLNAGEKVEMSQGSSAFYQNTGKAFFHPVTHKFIQEGQLYKGAACMEHENKELSKGKTKQ